MKNFKEILDLPYFDLYNELLFLIEENIIPWNNITEKQICINSIKKNDSDIKTYSQSLIYDWHNSYKNGNGIVKFCPVLKESDFIYICNQFKGTLFEEVFILLKEKYNVGRIRIMTSPPKTCLTWHTDDDGYRLHYPLNTDEGCIMVIENEAKHLQKNKWYITNTLKPHTAFNGTRNLERIHLVGSIIKDSYIW